MKKQFKDKDFLSLVKGGGVNFIFYGLNLVIVYVLAIVLSKYYGAAAYGRYSIIKSLILVLIIFSSLGLNTLAIKLASNRNFYENKKYKVNFLKKSYLLIIFTTLIISTIIFFLKRTIAVKIFNDSNLELYLTYFPFILFFAVFLNYNSNLLKGQGKIFMFSFVSSFFNNLVFIILVFFFFNYFSHDEEFILIGLLLSFVVAFALSFFKIIPVRKDFENKSIKYYDLLKESLPMMLSSSMIFVIFSVDTLMLGYFETSDNVGIYRVVTQISSVNAIALVILNAVVGPKISQFNSCNNKKKIVDIVYKSSKLVFLTSIPILILIVFFSKEILFFFGEEYLKGYNAIIILSICQFIYAISGFADLILNMTGKQRIFGRITIFTAMGNICLNFILIPNYGITGAAVATGISILLTNLVSLYFIKKEYNFLSIYIPFLSKNYKSNNEK